jgi:hypothetical protein
MLNILVHHFQIAFAHLPHLPDLPSKSRVVPGKATAELGHYEAPSHALADDLLFLENPFQWSY